MDNSVKKFKLLSILLFFASVVLLVFGMAGISKNTVKAEENPFKMHTGASVRLAEGETGIRFLAYVPEPAENDEKEYRMLIVPEKLLTLKNIESDFVNALKKEYPEQSTEWETNFGDHTVTPYYSELLNSYVVSGALGVSDAHKNEVFCGIAYYKDGENFVYAGYDQNETIFDNARSVSYVSSLALNSGDFYSDEQKGYLNDFVSAAIPDGGLSFANKSVYASKINSPISAPLNNEYKLDFKYEVENGEIASVENGVITVKEYGETVVTAKIGNAYSAKITVGCPTDEELLIDATVPDQGINIYHRMGTVAVPADESAPDGFKNSLKYVLTPAAVVDSNNYYGYPVSFDIGNKYWTAYADRFSVSDWSDAYVTFKIYNAGTAEMKIGLTQGMTKDKWWQHSSETITVGVNESKVAVFSIKSAMGITQNIFETPEFKNGSFNVLSCNSISGVTSETLADNKQTIYISDFDIVNLSQAQKVRNVLLGKFAKAGTSSSGYGNAGPYMYYYGLLSDSVSTDVKKETDASIKYMMTAEPTSNASRYAAAISLTKAELERIAELSECNNFDSATVRFWVKNDFATALDVRLYCMSIHSIGINASALSTTTVANNNEWSLVEIDISEILNNLGTYPLTITFYYGANKTAMADGATFYLDGFKVYNK